VENRWQIERLQWLTSPENVYRAAQLRTLSITGFYSVLFSDKLGIFLEPRLEVIAEDIGNDSDDDNDAPAAEIPPLMIVHRKNV